jgi:hypothetical protein
MKLDESDIDLVLSSEDEGVPPELLIGHLKNQLFKAEVVNH